MATSQKGMSALTNLLNMQMIESSKPVLSKISWLPDVLRVRGSIIPSVIGPILVVTAWAVGVATLQVIYGKHLQLTNNVVPLLSIVVGLLLVFRNTSAYQRWDEGRKAFTLLISHSRNLSRDIWLYTCLPATQAPPPQNGIPEGFKITREELKVAKTRLVRLVIAFVIATKHHLRAESGTLHHDLRGLIPPEMHRYELPGAGDGVSDFSSSESSGAGDVLGSLPRSSIANISSTGLPHSTVRKSSSVASLGLGQAERLSGHTSAGGLPYRPRLLSLSSSTRPPLPRPMGQGGLRGLRSQAQRAQARRRPTAVRIHTTTSIHSAPESPTSEYDHEINVISPTPVNQPSRPVMISDAGGLPPTITERQPLIVRGIKAGVVPDERRNEPPKSAKTAIQTEDTVQVVELGLPLIIAHEISRSIYRLRRLGCFDAVGPTGANTMQMLVHNMTDQLSNMERIVQTPLPFIFAIHLKQCVTAYLLVLPFTLVDIMGWRMVPFVTLVAFTLMGVEGIASEIEQPFGDDPNDLNLDLYCAELRCEVEYILERLPEGDDESGDDFLRSVGREGQGGVDVDDNAADGEGDDGH